MQNIDDKTKRWLRTKAHALKPVVTVGNAGVSEGVLRELDLSLEHHELIKVRIQAQDRSDAQRIADALCDPTQATLVQLIGHIAIIYRAAQPPKLIPKR